MFTDPNGEFVSTILGAVFGYLWAAMTGQDVWVGMVAGAVAGLGVDIAIATAGAGAPLTGLLWSAAFGGIAAGGAYAANEMLAGTSFKDINWIEAAKVAALGAVLNIAGYGISYVNGLAFGFSKAPTVLGRMVSSLNSPSWIFQSVYAFTFSGSFTVLDMARKQYSDSNISRNNVTAFYIVGAK
jgi:hypothetical protein